MLKFDVVVLHFALLVLRIVHWGKLLIHSFPCFFLFYLFIILCYGGWNFYPGSCMLSTQPPVLFPCLVLKQS